MSRLLFTILPSNDLGLLTRSLPIAHALAERGHTVAFCSPGPAPSKVIAEAGFENLLPPHPLYYLMREKIGLRAAIAALGGEDLQVVLTTGHHALPKGVMPLPHNFYHAPFVPGLAMAQRSDLLIHHGGYGSCQTGLYTGTPAVIVPTYSERESHARRVAAVGAGEVVLPVQEGKKKRHVPAAELRDRVWKVLSKPSYTENARRISARLQTWDLAETASLIENFKRYHVMTPLKKGFLNTETRRTRRKINI